MAPRESASCASTGPAAVRRSGCTPRLEPYRGHPESTATVRCAPDIAVDLQGREQSVDDRAPQFQPACQLGNGRPSGESARTPNRIPRSSVWDVSGRPVTSSPTDCRPSGASRALDLERPEDLDESGMISQMPAMRASVTNEASGTARTMIPAMMPRMPPKISSPGRTHLWTGDRRSVARCHGTGTKADEQTQDVDPVGDTTAEAQDSTRC